MDEADRLLPEYILVSANAGLCLQPKNKLEVIFNGERIMYL